MHLIHRNPILLILILVLLLRAGSGGASASETGGEIIIGACLDISGPAAPVGSANLRGLQDYIELANQEGGILGKRVRVVWEDSKFNVYPDGLRGIEKIEEQFHPRFLVVDSSHLMMELLGYNEDKSANKIVWKGPSQVGPGKKYDVLLTSGSMMNVFAQEQIHPSVFVAGPTYGDQLKMLLRYAAREKKVQVSRFFIVMTNRSGICR